MGVTCVAASEARRRNRYPGGRATYGNLAYAEPAARPLERDGREALRPRPKTRPRERAVARPKVRVREAGAVSPFAVVGFLAVAVFAVLLMFSTVQVTMLGDQIVALEGDLSDLQAEEKQLRAQYELAYDMNTVEEKAKAAGMVKPQASQIYTLDLSEEDSVVHYEEDQESDSFLDAVTGILEEGTRLVKDGESGGETAAEAPEVQEQQ